MCACLFACYNTWDERLQAIQPKALVGAVLDAQELFKLLGKGQAIEDLQLVFLAQGLGHALNVLTDPVAHFTAVCGVGDSNATA